MLSPSQAKRAHTVRAGHALFLRETYHRPYCPRVNAAHLGQHRVGGWPVAFAQARRHPPTRLGTITPTCTTSQATDRLLVRTMTASARRPGPDSTLKEVRTKLIDAGAKLLRERGAEPRQNMRSTLRSPPNSTDMNSSSRLDRRPSALRLCGHHLRHRIGDTMRYHRLNGI